MIIRGTILSVGATDHLRFSMRAGFRPVRVGDLVAIGPQGFVCARTHCVRRVVKMENGWLYIDRPVVCEPGFCLITNG